MKICLFFFAGQKEILWFCSTFLCYQTARKQEWNEDDDNHESFICLFITEKPDAFVFLNIFFFFGLVVLCKTMHVTWIFTNIFTKYLDRKSCTSCITLIRGTLSFCFGFYSPRLVSGPFPFYSLCNYWKTIFLMLECFWFDADCGGEEATEQTNLRSGRRSTRSSAFSR